jgi:hypothetical protein
MHGLEVFPDLIVPKGCLQNNFIRFQWIIRNV